MALPNFKEVEDFAKEIIDYANDLDYYWITFYVTDETNTYEKEYDTFCMVDVHDYLVETIEEIYAILNLEDYDLSKELWVKFYDTVDTELICTNTMCRLFNDLIEE